MRQPPGGGGSACDNISTQDRPLPSTPPSQQSQGAHAPNHQPWPRPHAPQPHPSRPHAGSGPGRQQAGISLSTRNGPPACVRSSAAARRRRLRLRAAIALLLPPSLSRIPQLFTPGSCQYHGTATLALRAPVHTRRWPTIQLHRARCARTRADVASSRRAEREQQDSTDNGEMIQSALPRAFGSPRSKTARDWSVLRERSRERSRSINPAGGIWGRKPNQSLSRGSIAG